MFRITYVNHISDVLCPLQAVLVQEVLQSFYDFARVPYLLTADGDVQLAKIDTLGCLHLHTCQALVDPDAAYEVRA